MKSLIFSAVLAITSVSAQASTSNYLCKLDDSSDQTLLLRKVKDLRVSSRESLDYKAIYNLQLQTSELPFPSVSIEGTAKIADVQFWFTSKDKSISVSMYMDDLNGTITIHGKETSFSDCRIL